jgi:hypothetical protein
MDFYGRREDSSVDSASRLLVQPAVRGPRIALLLACLCSTLVPAACAKKAIRPRITLETTILRDGNPKTRSGLDALRGAIKDLRQRKPPSVARNSSTVGGEQPVGTTGHRDTPAPASSAAQTTPEPSAEPPGGGGDRLTTGAPRGARSAPGRGHWWILAAAALGVAFVWLLRSRAASRV